MCGDPGLDLDAEFLEAEVLVARQFVEAGGGLTREGAGPRAITAAGPQGACELEAGRGEVGRVARGREVSSDRLLERGDGLGRRPALVVGGVHGSEIEGEVGVQDAAATLDLDGVLEVVPCADGLPDHPPKLVSSDQRGSVRIRRGRC